MLAVLRVICPLGSIIRADYRRPSSVLQCLVSSFLLSQPVRSFPGEKGW